MDIEKLLLSLLRGKHSSLTLSVNDEIACNYVSVKEGMEQGGYFESTDWVSEEEKQKCIETNRVWTLHWYPDTPVGFYSLSASTLGVLMEAVAKGDWSK